MASVTWLHCATILGLLAALSTTTEAAASAPSGGGHGVSNDPNSTKNEHDLFDYLFTSYNKHIRPIKKAGSTTYVFFELSLFNILEVNTKRQAIITNSEMILKWKDDYISWDPADYSGIEYIRVPYSDIWYPDIILINTAAPDYAGGIINTNAIIHYDGEVELTSHIVLNSICIMDIQWYPFDQQLCDITFASWTYDRTQIQLIQGPADLSEFSQNPEFFLEDFYAVLHDLHNPCCAEPMSTIIYYIQIQRRTIFSLFFFITPGILINICALMVFSLPAESGEKVGLGINSMLAMMVFLMAMTEKLPPTEKLPLAGVYYGACISIITMNITLSVTVLNLNVMGMRGYQVPQLVRVGTLFVARMILVRIPRIVRESWDIDDNNRIRPSQVEPSDFEEAVDVNGSMVRVFTVQPHDKPDPNKKQKLQEELKKPVEAKRDFSELTDPFQRRTVLALESINKILAREEKSSEKATIKNNLVEEWKFISRVMDRTLFITFSFSAVIFNITILTSSPFGELFSYCPGAEGECEGLTMEEIVQLTAHAATGIHLGDGGGGGGDSGGGHGAPAAPAAHRLYEGNDPVVSIYEPDDTVQAIPGLLYEGYEGLGLLQPGSLEAQRLHAAENPTVPLVGPKYTGYEGLGLLVSGSPEAEKLLAGQSPVVPLSESKNNGFKDILHYRKSSRIEDMPPKTDTNAQDKASSNEGNISESGSKAEYRGVADAG